jgi:hypothetical protein
MLRPRAARAAAARKAPPPRPAPRPPPPRAAPRRAPLRSRPLALSAAAPSPAEAPPAAPLTGGPGGKGDLVAWREWELSAQEGDITWPAPLTLQQRVARSLRFWTAVGPVIARYQLLQVRRRAGRSPARGARRDAARSARRGAAHVALRHTHKLQLLPWRRHHGRLRAPRAPRRRAARLPGRCCARGAAVPPRARRAAALTPVPSGATRLPRRCVALLRRGAGRHVARPA